jgi:ANTAR domain/PAS fold
MSTCEEPEASPVELALAGGMPQRAGWYRYHFGDERWEWSPDVETIHGYEPGTVYPTTELVLRHKHPEDRELVAATLRKLRRSRGAFSARHRIITVQNEIREVLIIGECLQDGGGAHGFYIDVTPDDKARNAAITEAVSEIADNRAIIEQVKGILRLVYRIDADAAFELLKWRSQETNVKLRALAEQLMVDVGQLADDGTLPPRATFDHLLLTAHERVRGAEPQQRAGFQG